MMTMLAGIVIGAIFLERMLELAIGARNTRRVRAKGAIWTRPDGFWPIVVAQGILFIGTTAEVAFAPWAGEQSWTWWAIGALVAAQALRYWCIGTLGERWNPRVVTVPGAPRITGGPYRFLPHPNYVAVMLDVIALPLAFGAFATLLVAAPLQLAALVRRVRIEERALIATYGPTS